MMRLGSCLKLPLPIQGNRHQLPPPPKIIAPLSTKCTLTKQAHRFLSTLTSTASRDSSSSAIDKLIRKFVESSPKSVALRVLSHLLSPRISQPHLSSLALPVSSITVTTLSFHFLEINMHVMKSHAEL